MKGYTDLEQSKKLAEFLPIESADMYYSKYDTIHAATLYSSCDSEYFKIHEYIPCWSLAALFNLIPKHIKDYNVLRIDINENKFAIWYDEIGYGVNDELPDIWMKEPVDACVEMILKLKEKNQI